MHKIIIKTLIVIGAGAIFAACAVRSTLVSDIPSRISTNMLATLLLNESIILPTGTHLANEMIGNFAPLNICQSCHPEPQMQRLQEDMVSTRTTCTNCHGGKGKVGNPLHKPCLDCHSSSGDINTVTATRDNERYSSIPIHPDVILYCEVCHIEKSEAGFRNIGGGN